MYFSTARITKYVSISHLSTVCLVCNVQLTEVKIVFRSNKWVALTRAGWCVVYIVDYAASSIRFVDFRIPGCRAGDRVSHWTNVDLPCHITSVTSFLQSSEAFPPFLSRLSVIHLKWLLPVIIERFNRSYFVTYLLSFTYSRNRNLELNTNSEICLFER